MLIGSTRIVLAILQPPFGLADPIKKKLDLSCDLLKFRR